MKNYIFMLKSYIGLRFKIIILFLISIIIYSIVFALYSLPLESIVYATSLVAVFLSIVTVLDIVLFYKRYFLLEDIKKNLEVNELSFPMTKNLIYKEYEEIIENISKDRMDIINQKDEAYREMVNYYTTWTHQIKTPIAAMRLLLQTEKTEASKDILEQLFRVEEYVEMVHQYIRTENMSSDLLIKRCSLDNIVKQGVRKYSKLFIRKKIKLNYEELNVMVLTDEKWLAFVIEQILSNALKYTNEGEISIYMEGHSLIIKDTGIGIESEDLPRIFEKGFTGFTGRKDKKSSGIGLSLCKKILDSLSHTISISSEVSQGTKVKIGLDIIELDFKD